MKYLVIGMGNFGKTLAEELTDKGNDVIGVDCKEHRIEEIKNRIDVAYILDATEVAALRALPLDEIDCTIVAIGQSMDASLRTVAALKALGVKNIYARAIDQTHRSILAAMSLQQILMPECYAARLLADKLSKEERTEMV